MGEKSYFKLAGKMVKLDLRNNHYYFCLLAELYRMNNNVEKEMECLKEAIALANKPSEVSLIKRKLENAKR